MMTRENFTLIAETFFDNAEIVEFCQKEMAKLDKKADAKKAASAENQALEEAIVNFLDGNADKTATEVGGAIGISTQKASYMLRQMVNDGRLTRKPDGRRYTYALA